MSAPLIFRQGKDVLIVDDDDLDNVLSRKLNNNIQTIVNITDL